MVKYNLYDLLEVKSKERLLALMIGHPNLNFSEEELARVNLTKESIYLLIASLIKEHSGRRIELKKYADQSLVTTRKRYNDLEDVSDPYDEEKIKKNIQVFTRYNLLRALFKLLFEREMAILWSNHERIRKINEEIDDLVRRKKEAEHNNEEIFMQQLNEHRKRLEIDRLNSLMQQRGDLLNKAKELKQAQKELRKNIDNMKEMKRSALKKSAKKVYKNLETFVSPEINNYLSKATDQQKQLFIYEIIKINHKLDVHLHKINAKISKTESELLTLLEEKEKLSAKDQALVDSFLTPMYGKKKGDSNKSIQKNIHKIEAKRRLIERLKEEQSRVRRQRNNQVTVYKMAAKTANLGELAQAEATVVDKLSKTLEGFIEPEVAMQNEIANTRRGMKGNLKTVDADLHLIERQMEENTQQNRFAINNMKANFNYYSSEQQLAFTKALNMGAKFDADMISVYGKIYSLEEPEKSSASFRSTF